AQRLPKIHVNDVDRVINATLDTIKAEVTAGGEVNLIGFGKFSVKAERIRARRRT
ncbi:MAG: HU family DNA-binding protein, partial [Selenomonadaceae bacterium]|nr:HU family DNA-binding protein [Selenomonadaceae bacterium]